MSRGVAAAVLNVHYYVLLPLDPTETLELFRDQQGKDSTGHWEIYQSAKAISGAFSNTETKNSLASSLGAFKIVSNRKM